MRQLFTESYLARDSLMHTRDPRIKTAGIVLFTLFVIITDPGSFQAFWLYGAILLALIILSKIPAGIVLARSLVIVPFVVLIALSIPFFHGVHVLWKHQTGGIELKITQEGLLIAWGCIIKAYLSTSALIILICTTTTPSILKALESFRIPRLFVMVLSFMIRYIHVLADEMGKMIQGKRSRSAGKHWLIDVKVMSCIAGVLFLRSFEKGEMVHNAMSARGYSGTIHTLDELSMDTGDFIFIGILSLASGGVYFLT